MMAGESASSRSCAACGASEGPSTRLLRCSRCQLAWYCSARCQRSSWAAHRPHCRPPPLGAWAAACRAFYRAAYVHPSGPDILRAVQALVLAEAAPSSSSSPSIQARKIFVALCLADAGQDAAADELLLAALRLEPQSPLARFAAVEACLSLELQAQDAAAAKPKAEAEAKAKAEAQAQAQALALLRRARDIAGFCVAQQVPGLRWSSPFQRPACVVEGLAARPFWRPEQLARPEAPLAFQRAAASVRSRVGPSLRSAAAGAAGAALEGQAGRELEAVAAAIGAARSWDEAFGAAGSLLRREFEAAAARLAPVGGESRQGFGLHDGRALAGGRWTELPLLGRGADEKAGATTAPATLALLDALLPEVRHLCESGGGEVCWSRLGPRSRISAHCAASNLRLTVHIPLVVPAEGSCAIRVGEEWRPWRLGQALVFDDSFEHEVRNDSDEPRVVLLARVWHPGLGSAAARAAALRDAQQAREQLVKLRAHPPLGAAKAKGVQDALWEQRCRAPGCPGQLAVDGKALDKRAQLRAVCAACGWATPAVALEEDRIVA